jgi:hypothetical protein
MTGTRKVTVALVLVAAAVATGVAVTRGDASRDVAALSNRGGPTIAVRGLRLGVTRITSGNVLGIRNGRALYRLNRASGDPCFGVGPSTDIGNPGSVVCPRGGFPTSGSPVLDFSVYEGARHDAREFSLYRVAGLAADGIAAVEFLRPGGALALRVAVSGNVYATTSVPKGPVAGFVAVDKDDKRVWRSPGG